MPLPTRLAIPPGYPDSGFSDSFCLPQERHGTGPALQHRASLSASAGFACAATARGRSACPIPANAEFLAEVRAALVSVAGLLPSGPPASPPRAETRPCKRPLRRASHGVPAMHAEPAPPLMAFFSCASLPPRLAWLGPPGRRWLDCRTLLGERRKRHLSAARLIYSLNILGC